MGRTHNLNKYNDFNCILQQVLILVTMETETVSLLVFPCLFNCAFKVGLKNEPIQER